jgi:hypothetical protein
MLYTVKKVEYVEGYKLKLLFNDRRVKMVNLENMLKNAKNMFVPLMDVDYFKKVKCDGISIYWPNGVDLCPDVLYKMGENAKQSISKRSPSPQSVKSRKKSKLTSR